MDINFREKKTVLVQKKIVYLLKNSNYSNNNVVFNVYLKQKKHTQKKLTNFRVELKTFVRLMRKININKKKT